MNEKPEWVVGAHDLVWQGIMVLYIFCMQSGHETSSQSVSDLLWLPYERVMMYYGMGPFQLATWQAWYGVNCHLV
jgi:hypothetical protein